MSRTAPRTPPTLQTDRIRLRALASDDLDDLWSFLGRADVMAHYVDLVDRSTGWSRETTASYLESSQRSWTESGYGRWAVELQQGQRVIGVCGLTDLDWLPAAMPAVELGFRFHPEYWGQGLAPEAAAAALQWAFDVAGLDSVLGIAVEENTPSLRALRKLGMTYEESLPYTSAESGRSAQFAVHRMTRAAWSARHKPS